MSETSLLERINPWKKSLQEIQENLEKKLYSDISKNILLANRMEANSILLLIVRDGTRTIDTRMEALLHLVDVNAPFLKPRTNENARQLLSVWGRLVANLWAGIGRRWLEWRRSQPSYDFNLPSEEEVEQKVAVLCELHLILRGILLVEISYGEEEITPQYVNIMKQQMMMPTGAGGAHLFDGE